MKVILNQAVPKLGKAGQVVAVKDGYARNFLFPKGLAVLADKSQLIALEKRNARVEAKVAETKATAVALGAQLDGAVVSLEGKVGRDGSKLFGAITSQDIADKVKADFGITIDKKQIALVEPIKRLGRFSILLDLHRDVDAHITVRVFDPANPDADAAEADTVAEPAAEA